MAQSEVGRTFPSGATRDQDDTKPDYRGFLCPLVQRRFGEYMLEHQRLADGTRRESDNWKKGMSSKVYLESLLRHVQELAEQFEFQRPAIEPPRTSADWNIADIKPYPGNPRINDGAVEAVAKSLREFTWRQPVVVDTDGVIIVGHTRWKAAQKLGLTQVPVHVATDLSPE